MDEPTTDSQRRDALHTNPDPELCACAGSGQYQAARFEHFDCPHHGDGSTHDSDGQPVRCWCYKDGAYLCNGTGTCSEVTL